MQLCTTAILHSADDVYGNSSSPYRTCDLSRLVLWGDYQQCVYRHSQIVYLQGIQHSPDSWVDQVTHLLLLEDKLDTSRVGDLLGVSANASVGDIGHGVNGRVFLEQGLTSLEELDVQGLVNDLVPAVVEGSRADSTTAGSFGHHDYVSWNRILSRCQLVGDADCTDATRQ